MCITLACQFFSPATDCSHFCVSSTRDFLRRDGHSHLLFSKSIVFVCWHIAAYIYIRGEFYNEASNMQIAIQEVSCAASFSSLANLCRMSSVNMF